MLENENIDIEKYNKYKKEKLIECHKSLNLILKLNEYNLKITRLKDSNYKVQTIKPCTICYPYKNKNEERVLIDVLGNYTFDRDFSCLMELPQNKRIIQFYAGLKDISRHSMSSSSFRNSEGARRLYSDEEPCLTILDYDCSQNLSLETIPCMVETYKDTIGSKPIPEEQKRFIPLWFSSDYYYNEYVKEKQPYSEYTFLIDNRNIRKYEPDGYLKRILKDNPYL